MYRVTLNASHDCQSTPNSKARAAWDIRISNPAVSKDTKKENRDNTREHPPPFWLASPQLIIYASRPDPGVYSAVNTPAAMSGRYPIQVAVLGESAPLLTYASVPDILVAMVYMSAKPMSVELKQFVSLTRPILGSPGSAKMMSTHCLDEIVGIFHISWLPAVENPSFSWGMGGGECDVPSIGRRRAGPARLPGWWPDHRL